MRYIEEGADIQICQKSVNELKKELKIAMSQPVKRQVKSLNPKIKYRSFRKQYKYCIDNDFIKYETCPHCWQMLEMCRIFGGQCRSEKCKSERERIGK